MSEFRRLDEDELARRDDDALLAYVVEARDAGDLGAAKTAFGILAWGYGRQIRGWISRSVPPGAIDDVFDAVLESLLKASFDGVAVGEFVNFAKTVVRYRVADWHEAQKRLPQQERLGLGDSDGEDEWGYEPSSPDDKGVVGLEQAIERVLAQRQPLHRRVIELTLPIGPGLGDLSADQVQEVIADETGEKVSVDNVHQILSRFRADLAKALKDDDGDANG